MDHVAVVRLSYTIDTAAIKARIEELDSVMMDLVEVSSRPSVSAD